MQLLTVEQIAQKLQVSKFRVYEMARLRLIPCVRMGRQIRFDEKTFAEWIAKGGSKGQSEERFELQEQKLFVSENTNKILGGYKDEK